ncbi:MAG: hypothetical protein JWM84_2334 [Nocardioides sp.]|nr:hypothetical protein [Nocardioides sp.]
MTDVIGTPADSPQEHDGIDPTEPPPQTTAADAKPGSPDHERKHLRLMLLLTFGTGMIDAIGYLGLDRVFTGNMTGNVVILGMAVAGSDDLPIVGPLLALVGFMAGAAIAGRSLPGKADGWIPRFSWILVVNALAMIGSAVALLFLDEKPTLAEGAAVTTALAIAMGLQAGMARIIAVRDVTTVVVTSTITSLAADSVLGANRRGGAGRRVASITLITLGALVGALFVHWHLSAGLFVAAALSLIAAAVGMGRRLKG